MMTRLRSRWQAATPRERVLVYAAAALLAVALYAWLLQAAGSARARLTATVATLRADAARLDLQAAEMARLRSLPAIAPAATDLRTQVQNQADGAGLSRALLGITVIDPNQVQVAYGSVGFAAWLAWVDGLQKLQVRLDTCRIEALSTPGLVSVTATFTRARPQ